MSLLSTPSLRNKEWEVPMRTRPLLRNKCHREMITTVNHLRTRPIHCSPRYCTIYRSLEIIFEWGPSIGLEFKSNVLCKPIASKKHSIWYDLNLQKYFQLKKAAWNLTDEPEWNASEDIWENCCYEQFFSTSPAKRTRKAHMKRKSMNTDKAQWKEPGLTTLINEVGSGTNTQSKQPHVAQYKG